MAETTYGGATILQHPLVIEYLLPFLLVFTVVFALLQKSEILGKGKKQIDALVALVMGLIVLAFARSVLLILQLGQFVAVALVIILVFLLLWGMFFSGGEFKIDKKVQWVMGGLAFVAVLLAVLYFTGTWEYLKSYFSEGISGVGVTIIFLVVIGLAVAVALGSGGSSSSEKKS
ncbi:MAG TPA: hypothetical protein VJK51_04040 [Candidatus Nanoarchaeia archaeon]|nr:hypothetical protein [Candidatus Nanoarchaeia archaeon]